MKLDMHSTRFLLCFCALLQVTMLAAISIPSVTPSIPLQPNARQVAPLWFAPISHLMQQADTIVRAQVIQSHSQWNSTHTLIETAHKLAIYYTLIGKSTPEIMVRTDGGFLVEDGLGMRSSHTASLTPGEEVLVFLRATANGYQIVGGEAGKLTVSNGEMISAFDRNHQTLDEVVTTIRATATSQGRSTSLPHNWRAYEPSSRARALDLSNQLLVDPRWPGATPKIKAVVNLNSPHIGEQGGSAQEFLTAIKNALRSWSVVETAEFTFLYDGETTATSTGFNHKSEILFMNKGATSQLGQAQVWFTSNGTIVEADIWINNDYPIDATGNLQADEIDLESVVLHELGHWLPLSHINNSDAVMYAVLGNGMRKVILSNDDIAAITALYTCPAPSCIDPIYANSGTPTPTSTVEPTVTATLTAPATVKNPSETATATTTPTLIPTTATVAPETGVYLPIVTR